MLQNPQQLARAKIVTRPDARGNKRVRCILDLHKQCRISPTLPLKNVCRGAPNGDL